jgi:hypothetical protein
MGQTARTTKLLLDLSDREQGGANREKRRALKETVKILDAARAFYLAFFLAHPDKLQERVQVISPTTGEVREALISADKLLTWAEYTTVATEAHPDPLPDWNFSRTFPDFPNRYRRSVIKDCIGKARGYLTQYQNWQASGKRKGKPGIPTASNHPTLYAGTFLLELGELDLRQTFACLKVYSGSEWTWLNYPTRYNRFFEARRSEPGWESESPKLVLSKQGAAIHFLQTKQIKAKTISESKRDPNLVTVGVDLNVKFLAVITVRQHYPDALCFRSGSRPSALPSPETHPQEAMAIRQSRQRRAEQSTALGACAPPESGCCPQNGPRSCRNRRAISGLCAGL